MTTMMLANSTTLAFRQSIEKSPRSKYSILEQNCAIAVPEIPANSRVVEEKNRAPAVHSHIQGAVVSNPRTGLGSEGPFFYFFW